MSECDMDEVFKVIDKHIGYFDAMSNESMMKRNMAKAMDKDTSLYERELMDFASAIASLKILKKELSGEIVY